MTDLEFLEAVQSRAARIAVGASTVRGRGNKGAVAAAREHLRSLDLKQFGSASQAFATKLDQATEALRAALPRGARHWGVARKVLNIFLRDCLYTTYLNEAFGLRSSEHSFELPLDSITVKHLKRSAGRGTLPPWLGVKHLEPSVSATYQAAAAQEAAKKHTARVHLDALWWSVSRDGLAVATSLSP
jgi:hypothetical protein